MKKVFQGQIIKIEDFQYDFLEIKGPSVSFLLKTPYFIVPSNPNLKYLILNYYKIENSERIGLLKYDEFESYSGCKIECIKTELFSVDTPVEFQEFYKNDVKFLALKVKIDDEFEISIKNGTMIKDECFYKVIGEGEYLFETDRIQYRFNVD